MNTISHAHLALQLVTDTSTATVSLTLSHQPVLEHDLTGTRTEQTSEVRPREVDMLLCATPPSSGENWDLQLNWGGRFVADFIARRVN